MSCNKRHKQKENNKWEMDGYKTKAQRIMKWQNIDFSEWNQAKRRYIDIYQEVAMVHICASQFPPKYPSERVHLWPFCKGSDTPIPHHSDKTETQEAEKH